MSMGKTTVESQAAFRGLNERPENPLETGWVRHHLYILRHSISIQVPKYQKTKRIKLNQSLGQLVHQQILLDLGQLEKGPGVLDNHGPQSVHHVCRELLDRAHPVARKKTDGRTNWETA